MKLRVPTELSNRQIEEFQRIWKERYDENISEDKATKKGLKLIQFITRVIDDK